MPYVTEFNESRVISDLTTEIKREITSKDIYHNNIPFLNALELSRLYDYKRFCEGDIDLEYIYQKAEIIDRKKYVFEGNQPSYHKDKDCPFLHSRFKNIELPDEVQSWSSSDIEEYRNWFKKEIRDLDNDELIISKIKEEWGIDCVVERVNFKNSGSIYKENLQLKSIEKRIDSLLRAQKDFFSQNRYYLARFSKATFLSFKARPIADNDTGLSDEELKKKLRYYHNLFKEPIIYYLKEYFKVKFSREVKFEEKLLDSLGFKKCRSCYSDNNNFVRIDDVAQNEKTELDKFLEKRLAKKLCRTPSELQSYRSPLYDGYLEFYYFCKLMAVNDFVEIGSKSYRELIIEYIIDDNIFYEKAYYDDEVNNISSDNLQVFSGYLVYTKFKNDNKTDFWRELYCFDDEELTNFY